MGKLNAYAIQKPRITATLRDVYDVKTDPSMRLTASPFVYNADETVFLGRAAPWKGAQGLSQVEEINSGVAEGLRRAIAISKSCAGVKGTVAVGGRLLPKKVLCQIEKAS